MIVRTVFVLLAVFAWLDGGAALAQTPTVGFDPNIGYTVNVNEGDGVVTLYVCLSEGSSETIKVDYATSNGSATSSSDYTSASGTLTFAPWETKKEIQITIIDDSVVEDTESFWVTLSNPQNADLTSPGYELSVFIFDDDVPPPTVQIEMATYSLSEGDGSASITVTLSEAAAGPVTVKYQTKDGSAIAGSDYTTTSGTLTFAASETSKTIVVPIMDDSVPESQDAFSVELSDPTGATLGYQTTTEVTINDDDDPPSAPQEPGLKLWQVTFSGPNHTVYESYTHQGPFLAPHWFDVDLDGESTSPGDQAYPVCYTLDTTMKASAIFVQGSGTELPSSILIRGIGPIDPEENQIDIPATSVSVSGSANVELPATSATRAFEDAIGLYTPMTIQWQFSVDNGANWQDAGTSNNRAFITLGEPDPDAALEWCLGVGCEGGKGKKVEADAVDEIWKNQFKSNNVKFEGKKIVYYKSWRFFKPGNYNQQVAKEILKQSTVDKDADCVGSCSVFKAVLNANKAGLYNNSFQCVKIEAKKGTEIFLVQDWAVGNGVVAGVYDVNYQYQNTVNTKPMTSLDDMLNGNVYDWKKKDVEDGPGIPCMNNTHARSDFAWHAVCKRNNDTLYDPSYGLIHDDIDKFAATAVFG